MALTPPTWLETLYAAFVRSDDMFIAEHAIMLLEEYQYTPTRDLLMKMTKEALSNRQQAALKALGLIRQVKRKR